jgi:subtilisin family serine protease
MSLGFDFPGAVDRMVQQGWPVPLATSNALEAYRANLRMFDALMQMVRASENFGGSAVIVAASGNESRVDQDPKFRIAASLPAAAEGVISVGALRPDGSGFGMAPFSNIFPQVSAPGVGILSAKVGGGLRSLSGTSMACPHVAGVAALWWHSIKAGGQIAPKATNIIDRLRATARVNVFGSAIGADDRGVGIVTAP